MVILEIHPLSKTTIYILTCTSSQLENIGCVQAQAHPALPLPSALFCWPRTRAIPNPHVSSTNIDQILASVHDGLSCRIKNLAQKIFFQKVYLMIMTPAKNFSLRYFSIGDHNPTWPQHGCFTTQKKTCSFISKFLPACFAMFVFWYKLSWK